jgi:glutamate-1-semialdehyde 2,1-aminomutase
MTTTFPTATINAHPVTLDPSRIKELINREEIKLDAHTTASKAMYEQAHHHLSGGVASSYQLRDPWPIYLEGGSGSRVWDVDGTEYYDFHNGFGSMVQGHAHPLIGKAIAERFPKGTHFAAPTEDAIVVGDELARRWGTTKMAIHQLWFRSNDGCDSHSSRVYRARHSYEDIRLLSRPSRHGDGVHWIPRL